MSTQPLFTPPQTPQPIPINFQKEADQLRSLVLADSRDGYRRLCQLQQQGIRRVWHHPQLTPQQAVAALGTDALRIFQAHGMLTEAIAMIASLDGAQPDVLLPSHSFTTNPDGTVTVGEGPYVPG